MKNILLLPRPTILSFIIIIAAVFADVSFANAQQNSATQADDSMVTLVSKDGASIQAELVSLDGNNLRIRRSDRQDFVFPLDMLNEESQQMIKTWQLDKALATSLTVQTRERRTSKEKISNISTSGEKYRVFIQFTVANNSDLPINDLRLEYRLYYLAELMNVPDKEADQERDVSGRAEIDTLAPKSNKVFDSNMVELTELRYGGDYVPSVGKRTVSKDKFHGFWYRLYRGKTLILEDASPKRLMRVNKW